MGRKRIKPMTYEQITSQVEKTITMLMKPAQIRTNCDATKEQAVSRAFGAFVLWEDLTGNFQVESEDKQRLMNLINPVSH